MTGCCRQKAAARTLARWPGRAHPSGRRPRRRPGEICRARRSLLRATGWVQSLNRPWWRRPSRTAPKVLSAKPPDAARAPQRILEGPTIRNTGHFGGAWVGPCVSSTDKRPCPRHNMKHEIAYSFHRVLADAVPPRITPASCAVNADAASCPNTAGARHAGRRPARHLRQLAGGSRGHSALVSKWPPARQVRPLRRGRKADDRVRLGERAESPALRTPFGKRLHLKRASREGIPHHAPNVGMDKNARGPIGDVGIAALAIGRTTEAFAAGFGSSALVGSHEDFPLPRCFG